MISYNIHTPEEGASHLAARLKDRRLAQNLTQSGLARRSGVPLGTLKKFESTGKIALVSFIRLLIALKEEGALDGLLVEAEYTSLDQVINGRKKVMRGRLK